MACKKPNGAASKKGKGAGKRPTKNTGTAKPKAPANRGKKVSTCVNGKPEKLFQFQIDQRRRQLNRQRARRAARRGGAGG